jgi:hypothetical protein
VTSTGTQTYGGTLSLTENTTLTGSTVATQGTVEGAGKSLTITGNAVLGDGASDTVTGLSSLSSAADHAGHRHGHQHRHADLWRRLEPDREHHALTAAR